MTSNEIEPIIISTTSKYSTVTIDNSLVETIIINNDCTSKEENDIRVYDSSSPSIVCSGLVTIEELNNNSSLPSKVINSTIGSTSIDSLKNQIDGENINMDSYSKLTVGIDGQFAVNMEDSTIMYSNFIDSSLNCSNAHIIDLSLENANVKIASETGNSGGQFRYNMNRIFGGSIISHDSEISASNITIGNNSSIVLNKASIRGNSLAYMKIPNNIRAIAKNGRISYAGTVNNYDLAYLIKSPHEKFTNDIGQDIPVYYFMIHDKYHNKHNSYKVLCNDEFQKNTYVFMSENGHKVKGNDEKGFSEIINEDNSILSII